MGARTSGLTPQVRSATGHVDAGPGAGHVVGVHGPHAIDMKSHVRVCTAGIAPSLQPLVAHVLPAHEQRGHEQGRPTQEERRHHLRARDAPVQHRLRDLVPLPWFEAGDHLRVHLDEMVAEVREAGQAGFFREFDPIGLDAL